MRSDSYSPLIAKCLLLLAATVGVAIFGRMRSVSQRVEAPRIAIDLSPVSAPKLARTDVPKPRRDVAPAPPTMDREAVAAAEVREQSAHADRLRAEAHAAEAAERLKLAQTRAASSWISHRKFATSIRDPSSRLASAVSRGEVLKTERDHLKSEMGALNAAPRPRRRVLTDKSPVARRAEAEEFHFEVRGDRIAYIDLNRLLEQVKTDARIQLRIGSGTRAVVGQVGPVGSFSIKYEVGRVDDDPSNRGNFGLLGWEIVPEHEVRGETFEVAQGPVSDFSRAINRLDPNRDVVTMWIYPDGFALYRQLREILHARGFLVAARPLPETSPIRGSPAGSASTAQ